MKGRSTLIFASALLAGMTFAAQAAKPELTGKEKKELAAKVAANQKKAPPQPRTMMQSDAAKLRSASTGAQGQLVATDLWNTLSVQTDANGKLQIVESDGVVSEAPKATEGLPNE
jgi:hypothetical protein